MIEDSVQQLLNQLDSLSTITETYQLPSKGRLDGIPNEGKVTLKMMTAHEEKMRTGSSGSFWRTMSEIINRCIVEPKGLDSYKLTVPDFIFLMYKLRIITQGNNLPLRATCPHCKRENLDIDIDLDKLQTTYLSDKFEEPMKVKLPKSGLTVECRLLRICEYDQTEESAAIEVKTNPTLSKKSLAEILRLCRQIKKIGDETFSQTELRQIIDKLPAADLSVLQDAFNEVEYGLDLVAETHCPVCQKKFYISCMTNEDFFRFTPKERRGANGKADKLQ